MCELWTISDHKRDEGNCAAGSSRQSCGCPPKDQYVITVMSRGLLIVLCKDRQMDPRGQQQLMFILLLCRGCSWYEYFCICFYTDEAWQGQWFSCHLGYCTVIGWPWQVMGVHVTETGVCMSVCALFCGKGHKGINSQTSQLLDLSLKHFK